MADSFKNFYCCKADEKKNEIRHKNRNSPRDAQSYARSEHLSSFFSQCNKLYILIYIYVAVWDDQFSMTQ